MVPSKLQKNNCHVTLEANQANRPRNTHSLGFATTSMRGQGHFAKTKHGQDKNGNEKDKRRQTERAPLKPFFVVCLITFPFGGRAQRPPPAAFLQDSSTFARSPAWGGRVSCNWLFAKTFEPHLSQQNRKSPLGAVTLLSA